MTMLETLRTMHDVIRGTTPAALGAAALHVSEARLSAYRRFIKGHIISTLYKNYTTMADILEGRIWVELASAYYHDVPADHWELNRCVRHFPEWLSRQLQAGKWPLDAFYVDLAVFEQREFAVYASTQEIETPSSSPASTQHLKFCNWTFP